METESVGTGHSTTDWLRPLTLFLALAGILASIALTRGLFDPDYFWHLATGEVILDTRAIPTTDPFSYTWQGQPWIPDQWLAEVLIAAGVRSVGAGPMLVVFGLIAAIGPAAVATAAMRHGVSFAWVAAVGAATTAALVPQVTLRPQVVSFALAGVLLALLMRARPESRRRLWLIPVLFLVWANAHGFFIVGLGVGAVYLVATIVGRTPMREHRLLLMVIGGVSLISSMLTPSGPGGLLYALSFADPGDVGAQQIVEWQSPNFHNAQFLPFLAILGLLFAVGTRRAPGWVSVTALIGAVLGLFASRSVGIGGMLIMPLLLLGTGLAVSTHPAPRPKRILELSMAVTVAIAVVGAAALRGPATVDPRRAPVAGTERIRQTHPDAKVLAAYEWGGYVISELYPSGGRVFADGRMHKYEPQVIADYLSIVGAEPGWEGLNDSYGTDALLLYPGMLLAKGPATDAGWCEVYRDELQVLLLPTCE
jgi:hypothetical protein